MNLCREIFIVSLVCRTAFTAIGLTPAEELNSFFKDHCIRCHGPDKQKGDIRLDSTGLHPITTANAELLERVLEQLRAGEMPPKKQTRPDPVKVAAVTRWISDSLRKVAEVPTGESGRPSVRRLNRTEYANTIRDLFGVEFEIGSGLPQDDSAHGFDNVGEALTLSPLLLEKYLP